MLFSIISLRVALCRQRHFGGADRQAAINNFEPHIREILVVVREVCRLQLHVICARVGALHYRAAAKREVAFLVQRVADVGNLVARYGLLGSVILLGASVLLDRHNHFVRRRRDRQLARICFFDDVVTRGIALSNRIFRKRCRIFADKRSLRANGNSLECQTVNRAVIAGNAMLFSIISLRVALCRQLDVLIIVEIDYVFVRVSLNRDLLGISRYRRVALDRNGGFRHGTAEFCFFCLRFNRFILFAHPIVVYRVVSLHRPHVFIIELYIFYRFVKIYLGVQIRIAFPFCF